jgi:hypothetical protein
VLLEVENHLHVLLGIGLAIRMHAKICVANPQETYENEKSNVIIGLNA